MLESKVSPIILESDRNMLISTYAYSDFTSNVVEGFHFTKGESANPISGVIIEIGPNVSFILNLTRAFPSSNERDGANYFLAHMNTFFREFN